MSAAGRGTGTDGGRPTRIEIDVSTLAVDGLTATGRQVLAEAFRRELTRLLQAQGLPQPASGALDVLSGLPALPATASPARLGSALARAVHDGLRRIPGGAGAVAPEAASADLAGRPEGAPSPVAGTAAREAGPSPGDGAAR